MIKLNVGGTVFTTTKTSLLNDEADDFFAILLTNLDGDGSVPIDKDENGVVLIDRSPQYFNYILNNLRDRDLQKSLSKEKLGGI